jgi:gas vesicle protein
MNFEFRMEIYSDASFHSPFTISIPIRVAGFSATCQSGGHMAQEDSTGGTVLMAFVLGAVAGAAVALLWAPAAGEDTRRRIREKADEARERANEVARQGREFIDRQRETFSTALDRGKEAYHRTRGAGEEA